MLGVDKSWKNPIFGSGLFILELAALIGCVGIQNVNKTVLIGFASADWRQNTARQRVNGKRDIRLIVAKSPHCQGVHVEFDTDRLCWFGMAGMFSPITYYSFWHTARWIPFESFPLCISHWDGIRCVPCQQVCFPNYFGMYDQFLCKLVFRNTKLVRKLTPCPLCDKRFVVSILIYGAALLIG